MDKLTGVSVIICCFNSARRLPRTLASLARQQVKSNLAWEVIVVDNNSNDGTAKVAQALWSNANNPPLHIYTEPTAGLIHARMCGLKSALYDVIIFCDDDNWLDETYIEKALSLMAANPKIGAIGGCGIPHFDGREPSWFNRFKSFYAVGAQQSHGIESQAQYQYLYGAGIVLRKSAMLELYASGFKHLATGRQGKRLLSGEDIELVIGLQMLAYQVVYSPTLTFTHFIEAKRLTWKYLTSLLFNVGYSAELLTRFRDQNTLTFPYPNYSSLWRETKALMKAVVVALLPFRKYEAFPVKVAILFYRFGALSFHLKNQHRFKERMQPVAIL
ncbi:MAG TPA: glycosyltransferase [Chryseosolibacter sp.]